MAFTKDHVRPKILLNGFEHGSSKWRIATDPGEATDGITAYTDSTWSGYGKAGVIGPASIRLISLIGSPQIAAFNQEDPCDVPDIDQARVSFMAKNVDKFRIERRDPGSYPSYYLWTIDIDAGTASNQHVQSGTTSYTFDPPQTNLLSGWHHFEFYWKVAKYSDYYNQSETGNSGKFYLYVDGRIVFATTYDLQNQMGGIAAGIGSNFQYLRPNSIYIERASDPGAISYIDDLCVVIFGDRTYPIGEDDPSNWYPNTDIQTKQIKQLRVISYALTDEHSTGGTGTFVPVSITNNAIAASAITPEQSIEPTTLIYSDGFWFMPNLLAGNNASIYFDSGLSTAEPTTTPYYTYWIGESNATGYDNKYIFAVGLTGRVGHIHGGTLRTSSFRFRVNADAAIDNIQRGFPHEIYSLNAASGGLGRTSMIFGDGFVYARPGPSGNREIWSDAKIEGSQFGFERIDLPAGINEPPSMVVESLWVSVAVYEQDPPKTNIQVEMIG